MPVSRETTEAVADEVAAVFARAEVRLLSILARHLAAGAESSTWAEDKLADLQVIRRRVQREVETARAEAAVAVGRALSRAYLRGAAGAQGDLDDAGVRADDVRPRDGERAVRALVQALLASLDDVAQNIVRQVPDEYRRAVTQAVGGTLTGATTRLQDAQHALDRLADKGVVGFTDRGGRRWSLVSYVEMATRTTSAQAAVQGHLDRLQDAGIPLVVVSDSSRECELCRPWEGKVLSRGPVPAMVTNAVTGERMVVRVDGTVEDAMRAGLMHPNCTHNLSAFIPGATRAGQASSNAEGYAEKVEQRRLERGVRQWKRREAAAMTPEAKARASAKVREWQGRVKAHTDGTGLPRKRERESLTRAR